MSKIAVVTGANAGLGFEITRGLAREGMSVIMACRNLEKAEAARQKLLADNPQADLSVMQLDISDPASISAFVDAFVKAPGTLDLLVNNAGIVAIPLAHNSAGHEMQLATNYLGVFALTGKLLPYFRAEGDPRIVNVNSHAHMKGSHKGRLNLDNLNWQQGGYESMTAYGHSKLALMTWTLELIRRLAASGSPVTVASAHPGFAATDIGTNSDNRMINPKTAFGRWCQDQVRRFIPTPEAAAQSILLAALGPDVKAGDYYGPGGFKEISGPPAPARVNPNAYDEAVAKRLWDITEEMTGVRYLSESAIAYA